LNKTDRILSPLQHVAAARIFDEPFDHPLWTKRHADSRLVYPFSYERGTADRWHIGGTWRNPPFSIESLTYQVVPEVGGHTLQFGGAGSMQTIGMVTRASRPRRSSW
jgi:alpha-ketoglutarate-dependent taurine dioxygenase